MDALILAAGYGTRLQPYTLSRPKALVEVAGRPMMEYAIDSLRNAGVDRVVVNVHHLGSQIVEYLSNRRDSGLSFWISDETDLLCDTGGGLRKAMLLDRVFPVNPSRPSDTSRPPLQQEPFFVFNADVWCNLDLRGLMAAHRTSGALVTMAVKARSTSRALLVNASGLLCGWRNLMTGEEKIGRTAGGMVPEGPLPHVSPGHTPLSDGLEPVAFSGIQVVSPALVNHFDETGAFSVMPAYLRLCATQKIQTYRRDECVWMDMGSTAHLERAAREISALCQSR